MHLTAKLTTCTTRPLTPKPFTTRATRRTLPARSLQAAWAQASVSDQQGIGQSEEVFIPLTKARKKAKQAGLAVPRNRLVLVGTAAGCAALAVGAGAAITALALDASQMAVASAALAAGAAVLPAAGRGASRRFTRSGSGRAGPFFGAMSLGTSAARNFSRAISSRGRSTQTASLHRLAATSQQSAGETTSSVIQPLEIEVVYDPPAPLEQEYESEEEMIRRILEQYTDEEWRAMAKVIEGQPCQVPLDDAMLFAEQFDPAYQLPGESVYPTPLINLLEAEFEPSTAPSARQERLKHKEKKKRKKKRKAT